MGNYMKCDNCGRVMTETEYKALRYDYPCPRCKGRISRHYHPIELCRECGCELNDLENGICDDCRWESMSDEDIADRRAEERGDLEREDQ